MQQHHITFGLCARPASPLVAAKRHSSCCAPWQLPTVTPANATRTPDHHLLPALPPGFRVFLPGQYRAHSGCGH